MNVRLDPRFFRSLVTDKAINSSIMSEELQPLLALAKDTLGDSNGEFDMWLADISMQAIDLPAIYIAAKNTNANDKQRSSGDLKVGVCQVMKVETDIYPTSAATRYFERNGTRTFSFETLNGSHRLDTNLTVIQQPKHGMLVRRYPEAENYTKYHYQYVPSEGYAGHDKFAFNVKAGEKSVKVHYTMAVMHPGEPTYLINEYGQRTDNLTECPRGSWWKISQSNIDPSSQDYAAWQRASQLSTLLTNASQSLASFQDQIGRAHV